MAAPIYVFDYVWLQMLAVRQALTGYADAPTALSYPLDPNANPFSDLYANTSPVINPLTSEPLAPSNTFITVDGEAVEQVLGSLYVQIYDATGRRVINSRGQNNNVEWTMDVTAHLAVAADEPEIPIVSTKILLNIAIQIRNIVNYGKWMAATPAGCFDLFTPQAPILSGISRPRQSRISRDEIEYTITDSFRMGSFEDWTSYANTQSNAMIGAY